MRSFMFYLFFVLGLADVSSAMANVSSCLTTIQCKQGRATCSGSSVATSYCGVEVGKALSCTTEGKSSEPGVIKVSPKTSYICCTKDGVAFSTVQRAMVTKECENPGTLIN